MIWYFINLLGISLDKENCNNSDAVQDESIYNAYGMKTVHVQCSEINITHLPATLIATKLS